MSGWKLGAIAAVALSSGCSGDADTELDKCVDRAVSEASAQWQYEAMLDQCDREYQEAKAEELRQMPPEDRAAEEAMQSAADAEANAPAVGF